MHFGIIGEINKSMSIGDATRNWVLVDGIEEGSLVLTVIVLAIGCEISLFRRLVVLRVVKIILDFLIKFPHVLASTPTSVVLI